MIEKNENFTTDMSEAEAAIMLANYIKDLPDDEQLVGFQLMRENANEREQLAFAAQNSDAGKAMLTFMNAKLKKKGQKNG